MVWALLVGNGRVKLRVCVVTFILEALAGLRPLNAEDGSW